MKRRLWSMLILVMLVFGLTQSATAQTYRFSVPKTEVFVAIQSDGTAVIEYYITFTNDPGASPIDFVDIGMPNSTYRLNNMVADVDGNEISKIENSPYVKPGIALDLGKNAIQPGKTGVVHLVAYGIKDIIYPSTAEEAEPYVGFQFSPNYFGSEFVKGKTDETVVFFLPEGLKPEEPRYDEPVNWPGAKEPASGLSDSGLVYYEWSSPDADSSRQYRFGAYFPARLIPQDAIVTEPTPRPNTGSGSTSTSGFLNTLFSNTACFGGGFIAFLIILLNVFRAFNARSGSRRTYLPPKVAIEGHGVKRGLTSVEAAVLMETPIEKVMTMILFSVIKKSAASIVTKDPLEIDVVTPLPEGLHPYEKEFLAAFQQKDKKARTKKLQDAMIALVKSVTDKMKGFSKKETVDYYKDIMNRAWEQVNSAETPEVKMEKFDEYMGWTMLDRDFNKKTETTFGSGPVFLPRWWGRYDPDYRSSPIPGTSTSSGGGGLASPIGSGSGSGRTISMPTLPGSAFAGSLVTGMQSFAANSIGNIQSFAANVTRVTNPPPPPSTYRSSSGGGRSGGGCACACACAGCACACAGGGR